ncbi:MAG: hypothetical protein JNL38_34400 [Myxococcales bacterium]|jgi:hypothetical protein|nr:hypothetical protein [Myxococcales bacterium]
MMTGLEIPAQTGDEALRVVRALGGHRYVAGHALFVHAAAIAAAAADPSARPALDAAADWAAGVLADPSIDRSSRDERLVRRASRDELVAVVGAFWVSPARDAVAEELERILAGVDRGAPDRAPFDEGREDEIFPVLIDAGWELLPLASLDPARHRGAIEAYGEEIAWLSAKFEEENAVPTPVYLVELPLLGDLELARAVDAEGALTEPLVVWLDGEPTYADYVMRGVLRAAKLDPG